MSDQDAVLLANDAFYRALAEGDLEAMDGLWARQAPVACIHPGWGVLAGRDEVMGSWEAIFSHDPPAITCRDARAHICGEAAFVTCYETLDEGVLVATNIFVREGEAWKMVHHQAGPIAPIPSAPAQPGTMH
jgi:hypothetical protein